MALMITVGLSGYLCPSEMFNVQGGDIQAPSELATEPYEGTCAG